MVGFGDDGFAVTGSRVLFRLLDLVEFLPHEPADEQLPALRAELAAHGGPWRRICAVRPVPDTNQ